MENGKNGVAEKSKRFAVRVIWFYKYVCSEQKEFVLSKQLLRSGTNSSKKAKSQTMPTSNLSTTT